MPILRHKQDANFVTIPNELAQNSDLSYDARGLLLELLSRPADWKIVKQQLLRGYCRDYKLKRIIKELRNAGYLHLINLHDDDTGFFTERVWIVCDKPNSKDEILHFMRNLPKVQLPSRTVSASVDNPQLQIQSNTKTDYTNVNAELRSEHSIELLSDAELIEHPVYQLYRSYYEYHVGSEHPKLSIPSLRKALQVIARWQGEDWHSTITEHFGRAENFETDWNFCHFATDGVLRILLVRQI